MSTVVERPKISGRPAESAIKMSQSLWARWKRSAPLTPPPRSEWPTALRRVRIAGFVLLAIQLLVLCWWGSKEANRFALTRDLALCEQAAWEIVHGHLNPFSTTVGYHFWQDHAMFIFWPLAYIQALWPHPETLLWIQDATLVASEAVALSWMCDIAAARAGRNAPRMAVALVVFGLVLMIGNPWTAWALSFDFHAESISTLAAILLAYSLYRQKRSTWLWLAFALLCGDLAAMWAVMIAVSMVLVGRRWLRDAVIIVVVSIAWMILMQALGSGSANSQSIGGAYAPLLVGSGAAHPSIVTVAEAVIRHPGKVLSLLWQNRLNLWGNTSSAGLIGLVWLPLLIPSIMVLIEGGLSSGGMNIGTPGSQNLSLYVWIALGTVAICGALFARYGKTRRWLLPVLIGVLTVNVGVWAATWFPRVSNNWLRVSPAAAGVLHGVRQQMNSNDEVVASQGIVGGLAQHESVYALMSAQISVPVAARHIWVVLAPIQGIETAPVDGVYQEIAALDATPYARLVSASQGIWAFEVTPPPGMRTFTVPTRTDGRTPAWTLVGSSGRSASKSGGASPYVASTSEPGYVIDQAYWRELPGVYKATVSLSVSQTANFEVWNSTTNTLVHRTVVNDTHGVKSFTTTFRLRSAPLEFVYGGWGLWAMSPYREPGDVMEIRVWSPGGGDRVKVHSVAFQQLSGSARITVNRMGIAGTTPTH
jgi:hypothetical protein